MIHNLEVDHVPEPAEVHGRCLLLPSSKLAVVKETGELTKPLALHQSGLANNAPDVSLNELKVNITYNRTLIVIQ